MKIWYFSCKNDLDYVIAFGNSPEDAWNKFLKSREGQSCLDCIEKDMEYWNYTEFNSETFGGALLFY